MLPPDKKGKKVRDLVCNVYFYQNWVFSSLCTCQENDRL